MNKKELRKQTNIGLREYPSRETIPLQVDRGEGIPSPPPFSIWYSGQQTIYPLLIGFLAALLHTGVVPATALPVAYTSKCVRTLQCMYEEAGIIMEGWSKKVSRGRILKRNPDKGPKSFLHTVTSTALP
jgi:hypothetical protein